MIAYRRIFLELNRRDIRYLVAGGVAVNLHQVQRATVDLDLILHLEAANILRFVDMVAELGFRPRLPVDPKDLADPRKRRQWREEKGMMVFSFFHPENPFEVIDVFAEEPKPFQELEERRLVVKAFGVEISVLGRADLIELKRAAGRDRDLFDVAELKKAGQGDG